MDWKAPVLAVICFYFRIVLSKLNCDVLSLFGKVGSSQKANRTVINLILFYFHFLSRGVMLVTLNGIEP